MKGNEPPLPCLGSLGICLAKGLEYGCYAAEMGDNQAKRKENSWIPPVLGPQIYELSRQKRKRNSLPPVLAQSSPVEQRKKVAKKEIDRLCIARSTRFILFYLSSPLCLRRGYNYYSAIVHFVH